jgi:hypothetical protein
MKEALSSSETSVLPRPKLNKIPVNAILNSHRRENLKSYKRGNIRSMYVNIRKMMSDFQFSFVLGEPQMPITVL